MKILNLFTNLQISISYIEKLWTSNLNCIIEEESKKIYLLIYLIEWAPFVGGVVNGVIYDDAEIIGVLYNC